MKTFKDVELENTTRRETYFGEYSPILGTGSLTPRVPFQIDKDMTVLIPKEMAEKHPVAKTVLAKADSLYDFLDYASSDLLRSTRSKHIERQMWVFQKERLAFDFELWAATSATIYDKEGQPLKFVLNYPQRHLLMLLEQMRTAGKPIRAVLLKARQWGGSTLVQLYQAWLMLFVAKTYSSAVVTSVEAQARHIRGMFTRMAEHHPEDIMNIKLVPYEGSKNRIIQGRKNIIGVGSFEEPENLRSFTFQMLHLSEVASWKPTLLRKPENFVQAIRSTVPMKPNTCIVLESTAKGSGDFFHREWQAAESGRSGYAPVFIPWYWIDDYQLPIQDLKAFYKKHFEDAKEGVLERNLELWGLGATLEGIHWYNIFKQAENYEHHQMCEEYPSTSHEAFVSSGQRVFRIKDTIEVRKNCRPPEFKGELAGKAVKGKKALDDMRFEDSDLGKLWVWTMPDRESDPVRDRYIVFVDIGGTWVKANKSVIRVLDRYWIMEGGVPEFVATWRGNIDHDILAWKATQVAKWYNNALLAVEDNSLNKEDDGSGHFYTILDEIADHYDNMFARTDPDKVREGAPIKYGFHTNKKTKPEIIDALIAAARDNEYIEVDARAVDEMDTYERKDDGKMGAKDGCNDDMVIATAGCVWICYNYLDPPRYTEREVIKYKTVLGEATI
jgi:hypothetical protein